MPRTTIRGCLSSDNKRTSRRIVHGSEKERPFHKRKEEIYNTKIIADKIKITSIALGPYQTRIVVAFNGGEEEVELASQVRHQSAEGSADRDASPEER
jgi:hypothetical protein